MRFISILFLFTLQVFAQKNISGKVTHANTNAPLQNVKVAANNQVVYTDINGEFKINVASNVTNLVFSLNNFITLTKLINSSSVYNVQLQTATIEIKEVIVTSSYGTTKKKEELVGSVATVKPAEMQVKQTAESFDKMLEGLVAGVQITSGSQVGAPVKINIRGLGSLIPLNGNLVGTSTKPLIIIDGVNVSEENGFDNEIFNGTGNLSEVFKNPLAKISPEDIESISILKDAAAVGFYGADGANGVIILTTKKSKSKRLDINFSTQVGGSTPINEIKYLSGSQYHQLYTDYLISTGIEPVQAAANAGSSSINTNWNKLLNRDGFFRRYNISLGKGFNNVNTRFSINYFKNEESQINNEYERTAGNINIGYKTNKFGVQFVTTPSIIIQNEPNTNSFFPFVPNKEVTDANGDFVESGFNTFGNPVAVAHQNLNKTKSFGALSSLNISFKLFNVFKINHIFGVDFYFKNQDRYFNALNESGQYNGTTTINGIVYPNWGRRLISRRDAFKWNYSSNVYYEKTVGNHNLDATVGLELAREAIDNERELGTGFINPFQINDPKNGFSNQNNFYFSENRRRSFFSQFNYNFNKKYFFLANARRDESSVFGDDVNAALNWGFGASWNISSEKFLENDSWIDFLRLKTSYGLTGNSRIGSYRARGLFIVGNDISDTYNGNLYSDASTIANPNLSWEKNYKFNLGIDFNFLNKYKILIEFFRDNITDQIVNRDIIYESGFNSIQINGAAMVNRGVEFTFEAAWFKKRNFRWTTNFNISHIKNKITDLKGIGSDFSASNLARAQQIGASTSAIWGFKFAGIDPVNGRDLYNINGQIVDAATFSNLFQNANNWQILGDSQPDFYGGFNNNFTINKNFSIGIRTAFKWGSEILIDNLLTNYPSLINRNLSVNVLDRWQKIGDNALFPRALSSNPVVLNSSRNVYDESHLKIQNIFFNYSVPIPKMKIKWIDTLEFNLDVSNVYYFYKEKSLRGRNGVAEYRFLYPESRTLTLGMQVNF